MLEMADKRRTNSPEEYAGPTRLFWGELARAIGLPRGRQPYLLGARAWPLETATLIQRVGPKWKTGARAVAKLLAGEGGNIVEPWDSPELVKTVEKLEKATPADAVAFVGRYGFLGYPDQEALNGEPLGWLRWQGRRMRYLRTLLEGAHREDPESISKLLERENGALADDAIWLPLVFPGAIRLYVIDGQGFRPPRTGTKSELLRAARYALRDEAQELVRRVQLDVTGARWYVGRWLPKAELRLQWNANLIDTVRLGMLWGVHMGRGEPSLRICPVCATPYVSSHGKKDCGSPRCGYTREKRQQRILQALGKPTGEVRWGLVRRFWELLNDQERELVIREAQGRIGP